MKYIYYNNTYDIYKKKIYRCYYNLNINKIYIIFKTILHIFHNNRKHIYKNKVRNLQITKQVEKLFKKFLIFFFFYY